LILLEEIVPCIPAYTFSYTSFRVLRIPWWHTCSLQISYRLPQREQVTILLVCLKVCWREARRHLCIRSPKAWVWSAFPGAIGWYNLVFRRNRLLYRRARDKLKSPNMCPWGTFLTYSTAPHFPMGLTSLTRLVMAWYIIISDLLFPHPARATAIYTLTCILGFPSV